MENEAVYEAVFSQSTVGIIVFDPHGIMIKVNAIIASNLGYQEEELINRNIREICPSILNRFSFHTKVRSPFSSQFVNKKTSLTIRSKEEKYLHFDTNISHTEINKEIYFIAYLTNKSDLMEDYDELEQRNMRFRVLAEVAPIGIYITDLEGNNLFVNRAWEKMTGMSQEEAFDLGWRNVVHPEDIDHIDAQ